MTNHDIIKSYSVEEFAAWFVEYSYQAGIELTAIMIENLHEFNLIDDIIFNEIISVLKQNNAQEKQKLITTWTNFLKEEYNENQDNSN